MASRSTAISASAACSAPSAAAARASVRRRSLLVFDRRQQCAHFPAFAVDIFHRRLFLRTGFDLRFGVAASAGAPGPSGLRFRGLRLGLRLTRLGGAQTRCARRCGHESWRSCGRTDRASARFRCAPSRARAALPVGPRSAAAADGVRLPRPRSTSVERISLASRGEFAGRAQQPLAFAHRLADQRLRVRSSLRLAVSPIRVCAPVPASRSEFDQARRA